MQPLNTKHAAILDALTFGMGDENPHRRIDNRPGTYMAVVVEKIGPCRYSVAHYYEHNGDLIADPDVEFVRQHVGWYPIAISQPMGHRYVAQTDYQGKIVSVDQRAYRDLRRFAGTLLTNIRAQQGDLSVNAGTVG
ncbi:MAG: hypothetical protein AB1Z98_03415 [Nannocystaceae bacterium]